MVNAYELISHKLNLKKAIDLLFSNKKLSRVNFVRLACHFSEFKKTIEAANILKKKVTRLQNLMQFRKEQKKKLLKRESWQKNLVSISFILQIVLAV